MVEQNLVQLESVERAILLESDLAALYADPVKALNRAVNGAESAEAQFSRSQSVTLNYQQPAASL